MLFRSKLRPLEMLFIIPYYDPQKKPEMRNKKNMNIKKNRNGVRDVDLFFDINYDTWKLTEPKAVVDCIERNKEVNPQEVFYRILNEVNGKTCKTVKVHQDEETD